ncbi:MAG: hypothetical protein ICV66_07775, partial [Chitinophagaceae bacterium]|nr:hypothetical protein [Chitinophagaceae bacterium]
MAGLVTELSQPLNSSDVFGSQGQVVVSALIAGTASKLGGGKFANGAASGAFIQLYNHNLLQQEIDDRYGKALSAKFYAKYFLDNDEAVILTKDEFDLAVRSNPTFEKCSLVSGTYYSGYFQCVAHSPALSPSFGWLGS